MSFTFINTLSNIKNIKLNNKSLNKNQQLIFWAVIILSIIIKVILIPYNMMDMGDSATRVWNALWWAEKPFFVLPESSNPLWFYFMGPIIMITKELFYTPIFTMIALMTISGIYIFKTTMLIADYKSALLALIIFLLNPVIFRLNFEPYSQQPYLTAVCIMVYSLLKSFGTEQSVKYFIIAGIFSFLALASRPEAIFIIPFFCLLVFLLKKEGRYNYILLSILFPVIWIIISYAVYGTPFRTIEAADKYTEAINIVGLNLGIRAKGFFLPYYFLILGLTFFLFWFFVKGVVKVFREKFKVVFIILLIPIIVPAVINGIGGAKSTLYNTTHYIYLMFFYAPVFAGIGLTALGNKINSPFARSAVISAVILSCIPLSYIKEFVPQKYNKLFPKVIQFIVTAEEPKQAYELIDFIDVNIKQYPALIFDARGSESSIFYIPFRTKLAPPEKILISDYNTPTDKSGLTNTIKTFILKNPKGIIMSKKSGTVISEIFSEQNGKSDLGKKVNKVSETEKWYVYLYE